MTVIYNKAKKYKNSNTNTMNNTIKVMNKSATNLTFFTQHTYNFSSSRIFQVNM